MGKVPVYFIASEVPTRTNELRKTHWSLRLNIFIYFLLLNINLFILIGG